jgi:hypothetical protein
LKFIKLKNTLLAFQFHSPMQKIGKHWQFSFNCNLTKTDNTVGKGRANIVTYVLDLPFMSFMLQKTIQRMSLVKDI